MMHCQPHIKFVFIFVNVGITIHGDHATLLTPVAIGRKYLPLQQQITPTWMIPIEPRKAPSSLRKPPHCKGGRAKIL